MTQELNKEYDMDEYTTEALPRNAVPYRDRCRVVRL